jgi:hypothetical protein
MLGGEVVNYNKMYELPPRLRTGGRAGGGMVYRGISSEERELGGMD